MNLSRGFEIQSVMMACDSYMYPNHDYYLLAAHLKQGIPLMPQAHHCGQLALMQVQACSTTTESQYQVFACCNRCRSLSCRSLYAPVCLLSENHVQEGMILQRPRGMPSLHRSLQACVYNIAAGTCYSAAYARRT